MSLYDYQMSRQISAVDPPFYALIMAAIRKADNHNAEKLKTAFPDTYEEYEARYQTPGGALKSDGDPK